MLYMKSIDEIRHSNLKRAIEKAGSQAKLATMSVLSDAYISQVVNKLKNKSGQPRTLGDLAARKIETGLDLPHGWMDTDHDVASDLSEAALLVARWFDSLSPDEQERFRHLAKVLTSTAISDTAVEESMPVTAIRRRYGDAMRDLGLDTDEPHDKGRSRS